MDYYQNMLSVIKFASMVSGSWPHQNPKLRRSIFIAHNTLLISILIPQWTLIFADYEKNPIHVITCGEITIFLCLIFCKSLPLHFASSEFKIILDLISQDWKNITDIQELAVLRIKYKINYYWVPFYVVFAAASLTMFNIGQFFPIVWKYYFASENETEFVIFQNHGLYPIEIMNRQHWACLHFALGIVSGAFSFISLDIFFLTLMTHVVGLFKLISYKTINLLNKFSSCRNLTDCAVCTTNFHKELRVIVQLHKKTIRIINLAEHCFAVSHGAFECVCVVLLAVILIEIKHGAQYPIFTIQVILACLVFLAASSFLNIAGHMISNQSNHFFLSIFKGNWYELPLKCRKSLHILIIYSTIPRYLTAAKLSKLSLEHLLAMLKTMFTYYTVFKSLFD